MFESLSIVESETPRGVDIPFAEREEFELLPDAARADVLAKIKAIRTVNGVRGQRWRRCGEAARDAGLTQSTVYESLRTWLATNNWRDLVDRRLVPEWQNIADAGALTPEMEKECATRIKNHKGGVRRAWIKLLRDLDAWRRGGPAIKGFGPTPPPDAPNCRHPAGLSYKNFKRQKNKVTVEVVQIGRRAAERFLPMVRATRVGVAFGAEWMIDDMYENLKALVTGQTAPRRVLRLHIQEYLTAYAPMVMHKPMHQEEGEDTLRRFGEKYTAYMVAAWATTIGGCAEGARVVGEGGTAKLNKDRRAALLECSNDLFKFDCGLLEPGPIVKGIEKAAGKGKSQVKAPLESFHNVLQREASDLAEVPGHMGRNPDDAPEDLYGREVYARQIIKVADSLAPGAREHLRLGFLALNEAVALLSRVQDRIHDEDDHALEGWEKIGHTVRKWRWHSGESWREWSELDALPAEVKNEFVARCEQGAAQVSLFRMSRRQAWLSRSASTSLLRLPFSAATAILGAELMKVRQTTDRCEFKVGEEAAGEDLLYFRAALPGADGAWTMLDRGAEYQTWFNPLDPTRLLVRDLAGRWVGACPQHDPTARSDAPAIMEARKLKKQIADIVLADAREFMAPAAAQTIADKEFNQALMAGEIPDAVTGRLPARKSDAAARKSRAARFARMANTGHTAEELAERARDEILTTESTEHTET